MKDIVISGKTVKRELYILLGCFVAALLENLAAVIIYKRPVVELVSCIGFVITICLILYILLLVLRLIVKLLLRLCGYHKIKSRS